MRMETIRNPQGRYTVDPHIVCMRLYSGYPLRGSGAPVRSRCVYVWAPLPVGYALHIRCALQGGRVARTGCVEQAADRGCD